MKKTFINGMACISAQKTAGNNPFWEEIVSYETPVLPALAAKYKQYIKPVALRRMSPAVKMGVTASAMALEDAQIEQPDAVITGTGKGCIRDTERFLNNLLENDEQFLAPTPFIQSTHNTVGGQIAMMFHCHSYNATYVQEAASFESALIDAQLSVFETTENNNILVGGMDELAPQMIALQGFSKHIKQGDAFHNLDLLSYKTPGSLAGEGAAFFVLSNEKNSRSRARLFDVGVFNQLSEEEVENTVVDFLKKNEHDISDIDTVILGNNGDVEYDSYYHILQAGVFKNIPQLYYKHLSGEYNTASAFGMWVGCNILNTQTIPDIIRLNSAKFRKTENILLYNQYRGKNHCLILLQRC